MSRRKRLELCQQVEELWERSAKRKPSASGRQVAPSQPVGCDITAALPDDREAAIESVYGESARLIQYDLEPLSVRVDEGSAGVVDDRWQAATESKQGERTHVGGKGDEVYIKQGRRCYGCGHWTAKSDGGRRCHERSGSLTLGIEPMFTASVRLRSFQPAQRCEYHSMKLRVRDQMNRDLTHGRPREVVASRPHKVLTASAGSLSLGALAVGALATGAMAIGAVAIARLAIGRARIRRLEIDELVVRRLRVTEELRTPANVRAEH